MAKREKKESKKGDSQAWLVTFSDMMTLLLTFFVLLLSMSTLDKEVIKIAFQGFGGKVAFLISTDAGRIPTRISVAREMLENPWDILEKPDRIKDLLFPDEIMPKFINKSTLLKNIEILNRPEGVVIMLSDKIVFQSGSTQLTPLAKQILEQVSYLIQLMNAPVNISGHTDDTGSRKRNFEISYLRAISVLHFFLNKKMNPSFFSISAYGPDRPLVPNTSNKNRAKNRRVEILIKNRPHSRTYL
ncbi:OmpA family protein [Desulfothermus sp.]